MSRSTNSRWRVPVGLGLLALVPLLGARSCLAKADYRQLVLLEAPEGPKIRVALVKDAPSVEIAVAGPVKVTREGSDEPLLDVPSLEKVTVHAKRGKLVWGSLLLKVDSVDVIPAPGESVEINGTSYRGAVKVRVGRKGSVTCVNEIALEVYLAGVLGAEVPTAWPEASLRAQAIAARTYALNQAWLRRDTPYDLTADTLSQVYRGLDVEDQTAFRIVHQTRGVILVYGGKIFSAQYMSVCGGHTASSAKVFGGPSLVPLSGTPCGYCRGAPRYRWPSPGSRVFFTEEAILAHLGPLGIPFRRIEKIQGIQRDPDGFAARVLLQTGGETFTVSGLKFRMALGHRKLMSMNFQASREGDGFVFRGKGWGHGVGMCQWGAYGMGRAGKTEREILEHYYPGATLARLSPDG